MASDIPVVAVCGATGSQGGNVVRGLLAAGNVRIRALTRNVESAKAQALAEQGCELVAADFNDRESLDAAFAGANRAFILTNSFAPDVMDGEKEVVLIKRIADSLAAVGGIEYVVTSIFEDTRPFLEDRPLIAEKWKVPHFDAKNEGTVYLRSLGIKVFTLNTAYYYENLFSPMFGVTKDEAGVITFAQPTGPEDKPFCLVSVEDIGLSAARLLADPTLGDRIAAENNGGSQDFGLRPEWLTSAQVGQIVGDALGVEVRGVGQDYNEFAAAMPFMGDEIASMFFFYCERREQMLPDLSAQLLEAPQMLAPWVQANIEGIRGGWQGKGLIE